MRDSRQGRAGGGLNDQANGISRRGGERGTDIIRGEEIGGMYLKKKAQKRGRKGNVLSSNINAVGMDRKRGRKRYFQQRVTRY